MTATIQNVFKENGRIHIDVRYTDVGVDVTEAMYLASADLTLLETQVAARKAQIANLYAFADGLSLGMVIADPPTIPAPTTLQIDSQQFIQDWLRWQMVEKAIANQILTGTEPQVTAFQTKVKNEFAQVITDAQAAGQTTAQAWMTALNLL